MRYIRICFYYSYYYSYYYYYYGITEVGHPLVEIKHSHGPILSRQVSISKEPVISSDTMILLDTHAVAKAFHICVDWSEVMFGTVFSVVCMLCT